MSLGYAQKLSYREDIGAVGMSEVFDPPDVLQKKIEQLALMIQESKHLVAFTGAGISTSCGIPDFRGPKGVWTLQRAGKGVPEASLPFHRAMPSLTHMALFELERAGILKFVISQNVDSLHLRSGIPREKLAELHGNSFRELCPSCGVEYIRDFEIETIGMKFTSRRCSDVKCGAKLRDTVLDWDDALPAKEMNPAEQHCRIADVVLCLGTSLQITPACNLPLKSLTGGGRIVIVNLQALLENGNALMTIMKSPTLLSISDQPLLHAWKWKICAALNPTSPHHITTDERQLQRTRRLALLLMGKLIRCYEVIAGVMHFLSLRIPPYVSIDFVHISLNHAPRKQAYVKWILRVESVHGSKVLLPFVKSVEVSFPERPDMKTAFLTKQPFILKRETARKKPFTMALKLNFTDDSGCSCATVFWGVDFQVKQNSLVLDKKEILGKLRDDADYESRCGQQAMIEKKILPRSESTIHAIATNIVRYSLPDTTKLKDVICIGDGSAVEGCMESENGDDMPSKRAKW